MMIMKKKYIRPVTTLVILNEVGHLMIGSPIDQEGLDHGDAKRHTTFDDADDNWQDDNPWETVAKPKNLWE